MRRMLLIAALVVLLFLDISLLPMALLLIIIGGAFGSVGQGGHWLPLSVFSLLLGATLIWLTIIVWRAFRALSSERSMAS